MKIKALLPLACEDLKFQMALWNAFYKKDANNSDLEVALVTCTKSLELSPNNPYSLNLLAEIYIKKSDSQKAKATNEEAVKYAKDTGDRELIRQIEERKF